LEIPYLLEPLGLLRGASAQEAIALGLALPLRGGLAFTLARLGSGPIVPAANIADAKCLSLPVEPWSGLIWDRPAIMGILNVTPDSFSDAGLHYDPIRAIEAGLAMSEAGADIIDVGGESTRPGAAPVNTEDEQARVVPVIYALARAGLRISVDTRNAATMTAALDAGATIVNDVSALSHDPAAAVVVASRNADVVLMHMRGQPATMNNHATYDDVVLEVANDLAGRVDAALQSGIARRRIIIDPGIGFAKTAEHNLQLLSRLPILFNLGLPILVGVSRKAFIGKIAGVTEPGQRLPGSLAAALFAVAQGASIVRVHDVAETTQALRVQTEMV
jgi:dihydropteroate synthase